MAKKNSYHNNKAYMNVFFIYYYSYLINFFFYFYKFNFPKFN